MKYFNSSLLFIGSIGILYLGNFSDRDRAHSFSSNTNSETSVVVNKNKLSSDKASISKDSKSKKGGQVVESGAYHLELVTEKEDKGTHLDFYLQRGDNHAAIPNAKVTAQIQMPDGTQKTLPFKYDTKDQHYTALLAGNKTGQYQLKMTADIKGEKVNGRFSFKQ